MPSPEVMERYEKLHPGATEFFFTELKKQTEHRQALDKTVIDSNVKMGHRGQWMAFVLFGLVAISGFAALIQGYDVAGTVVALGGLGAELSLFFRRRGSSPTTD